MAVPRAAAISVEDLLRLHHHAVSRPTSTAAGPLPLAALAVVLGDQLHVVRAFHAGVGNAEHVEQRLGEADHRVPRVLRILVLLAAQQPDHVEDRDLAVHRDAADRVHAGVEAGVLDHHDHRLAGHVEPGGHRVGVVLGRARQHAQAPLLVERGQHALLVRVGHADDPAERILALAAAALRLEDLLERVDDERGRDRFGHWAPPGNARLPRGTSGESATGRGPRESATWDPRGPRRVAGAACYAAGTAPMTSSPPLPDLLRDQDGRHPFWLRVIFLVAALVCLAPGVVGWLIPVDHAASRSTRPASCSWAWPATGRAASSTAWSGGSRRAPGGGSGGCIAKVPGRLAAQPRPHSGRGRLTRII